MTDSQANRHVSEKTGIKKWAAVSAGLIGAFMAVLTVGQALARWNRWI